LAERIRDKPVCLSAEQAVRQGGQERKGAKRVKADEKPVHRTGRETKGASQKMKYSFLRIMTGSDLSRRRLPLMAVESSHPGPVVWLTACAHGDEVGGIVIIQEIFKRIRKSNLLKGSVNAFPLMNPIGFETASRNVTLSKEDLNRSFPGDKNGSLAERIADIVFTTITETKPTLVLDLHNDWIKSIPYTLQDRSTGIVQKEVYAKTEVFGEKSGFLVVRDTDELERTLSYSFLKQGTPSLTLELGESYVVNEKNIEYGVRAIWNVLAHLEMVEPESEPFTYPLPETVRGKTLKYSLQPLSSASGIIRFLAKPGDLVRQGQPIAKIYNAFGKLLETMSALHESIVLAHSDSSVAFPGQPVMAFGVIEKQ
jgi:predicted deacylase